MKKLKTTIGKAISCLVLFCLFFAQGCKKESFNHNEAPTAPKQLIDEDVIKAWHETNPAAQLLTLDWGKARQAQYKGKNIVRVPTLNVDKISAIRKSKAPESGKNTFFYDQHPPEIYFVQDGDGGKLSTFLLNFIPKDSSKEVGENGIWTGRLYEWNLTGDTLAVQVLEKSKVKEKYLLKFGGPKTSSTLANGLKNKQLQSLKGLKDKQVSSIFTWLFDKIEDAFGYIGSLLGLSYWEANNIYGNAVDYSIEDAGYRINKIVWQSIFGTSDDEVETSPETGYLDANGTYTIMDPDVWDSYIPGYSPYGAESLGFGMWEGYDTSSYDVITSDNISHPKTAQLTERLGITDESTKTTLRNNYNLIQFLTDFLDNRGESAENLYYANWLIRQVKSNRLPSSFLTQASYGNKQKAVSLIYQLQLTEYNEAAYLIQNENTITTDLSNYLINNGWTPANKEFVKWAAGYLTLNTPMSFEELLDSDYDNLTPFPISSELNNYIDVTIDASETRIVMYPQDIKNYPKLAAIVKGLYNKVASSPKIMAALKKYTGFTEAAILNDLKLNKRGPIIVIRTNEQMKTKDQRTGEIIYPYGKTINNDANKPFLFLNQTYLTLLESSSGENTNALTLLIASVILHEYVHWADNNFALSPSGHKELGEIFEKDAFGGIIQYNKKHGRIYYRKN